MGNLQYLGISPEQQTDQSFSKSYDNNVFYPFNGNF